MKKTAIVLMDDLFHPAKRILPYLSRYLDEVQWHICVMTHLDHICMINNAPDLFINFKDSRDNWRLQTPVWYQDSFSLQIADFVTKEGCGYLAVHAGLMDIPQEHPIKTKVLHGGVDVDAGKPVFTTNQFFGKIPGLPFGLFSEVTFTPVADHPILEGIEQFDVIDEQLTVSIPDESCVEILGYASSKEAGQSIAAWACEAGDGRVAGISLGHLTESLEHPSMIRLIQNAAKWCARPN